MGKIKSFFKYLAGSDIFEERRTYYENFEKPNLISRINTVVFLAERYIPLIPEIDGLRRLVDGQYDLGVFEIFMSECLRVFEYLDNKGRRTLMDFAIRLKNEKKVLMKI